MVDNVRRECIMSMYEIYPLSRKLVFDTFDKKKYDITRTQQIIMLSLCIEGTLTMSQLASKINTSNEQATRAVAQLVDKGFVIRMQNLITVELSTSGSLTKLCALWKRRKTRYLMIYLVNFPAFQIVI